MPEVKKERNESVETKHAWTTREKIYLTYHLICVMKRKIIQIVDIIDRTCNYYVN